MEHVDLDALRVEVEVSVAAATVALDVANKAQDVYGEAWLRAQDSIRAFVIAALENLQINKYRGLDLFEEFGEFLAEKYPNEAERGGENSD